MRQTMAASIIGAVHDIPLMGAASVVPAGVLRFIQLREEGYAHIRP